MGDASSGSFLGCRPLCHFATLLFLSCFASLSSCLYSASASLLQSQLKVTKPPVASPELLELPCSLPVPAATLGYLFPRPMRETRFSLLGKTIRANNIPLYISKNMIYLNLLCKSSSALIHHSEAFRNEPESSFPPQQALLWQ